MKLNTIALLLFAVPGLAAFCCPQRERINSTDSGKPSHSRTFTLILALFICMGAGSGCAFGKIPLSAASIDSQVVDASTGKPIEGAVVVAYWQLKPGSFTGDGLPCGAANVEEAVTDSEGRFHLPGWGPIMPACNGSMNEGDPEMYVFKTGYHYGRFDNGVSTTNVVRTGSTWGTRQMKLKKFQKIDYQDRSAQSVVMNYDGINIDMGIFITNMPSQCNWKKIPNMLRVLELERETISQAVGYPFGGITGDIIYNDQWYQKVAPKCGSPEAFLRGLLK